MLTDERLVALAGWLHRRRLPLMMLGVGVIAAMTRFVELDSPDKLVFDELYYARGAYSLHELGYEGVWSKDTGNFANDDFTGLEHRADRVVHPPLGKWMIAGGIWAFGPTPFGWRFSGALIGVITVLAVAMIAWKLFSSTLWAGVAGLLLAVDGQHIVMSRTALLDIFLTFFVVLAFGFLVWDRHWAAKRLRQKLDRSRERLGLEPGAIVPGIGPSLGPRWYRLAAIVCFGLACGVKWSGLYFAAFMLFIFVLWDLIDRHAAGVQRWFGSTLWRSAVPGVLATLLIAPAVYVATWAPWFANENSYDRTWAEFNPGEGEQWLQEDLRSLWKYHHSTYEFHTGLTISGGTNHSYYSHNWSWLIQGRPTAFHYEGGDGEGAAIFQEVDAAGNPTTDLEPKCETEKCSSAITSLGHPLIWWAGTAALGWAVFRAYARRDALAATLAFAVFGGWLPWFLTNDRVIFTFYTVALAPFMVLLVAWALRRLAKPPRLDGAWSRRGSLIAGGFIAATLVLAGFFLPIWTGQWIPYHYWSGHMWIPTMEPGTIDWGPFYFPPDGQKFGWI